MYSTPLIDDTNSWGVDTPKTASRVDTTRLPGTPPGTYSAPLIDDTNISCVDTDVAAVRVDTMRSGDTEAAGG